MPDSQIETLTDGQSLIAEFQTAKLEELIAEQRKQTAEVANQELQERLDRLRNEDGELMDARYLNEHDLAMVGMFSLLALQATEAYQASPRRSALSSIGGQEEYAGRIVRVTARQEGSLPVQVLGEGKRYYDREEVSRYNIDKVEGRIPRWSRYYESGLLELVPTRRKRFRNISRYLVHVVSAEGEPLVNIDFVD